MGGVRRGLYSFSGLLGFDASFLVSVLSAVSVV